MITKQLAAVAVLSLVNLGIANAEGGDPAARLSTARSLRCTFTSTVAIWVRSGHPTVQQSHDKGTAAYDNIDIAKGTARIIANAGSNDLVVWRDSQKSLWMLERTPSGNEVVTTVFPMYAEGTDEFVVLEARHSIAGTIVLGQDSYGTCKVWQ